MSRGAAERSQTRVLFETSAEVLLGLRTAYRHYSTRAEPAFAEVPSSSR